MFINNRSPALISLLDLHICSFLLLTVLHGKGGGEEGACCLPVTTLCEGRGVGQGRVYRLETRECVSFPLVPPPEFRIEMEYILELYISEVVLKASGIQHLP